MEVVNVFITHKSSGSSILWRDVPIDTAKRICSIRETAGKNFMLVWSKYDKIGIYEQKPVIDNGQFDHLLTNDEKKTIKYWNGKKWRCKNEI